MNSRPEKTLFSSLNYLDSFYVELRATCSSLIWLVIIQRNMEDETIIKLGNFLFREMQYNQ